MIRWNDLAHLHAPLGEELVAAAARVIASGRYVLGEEVERFEAALAQASGRRHAIGVSSGTDALLATLMALGVGPGDEVVTTAFSFFATVEAIVRTGARPVFADVDEHLNLDEQDAIARVTANTRAIVAVDIFGRRARFDALAQKLDAGAQKPIFLVEDGAQAIGHPRLGEGVTAACVSFFPTKNLGALGDGGAVLTDDKEIDERLRLLRVHGSSPKYVHALLGGNFRLDALQAALLTVKLPHLAEWNARRRSLARRYLDGLDGVAGVDALPDEDGHVWHQMVVRVRDGQREKLRAHLAAREIATEIYYPLALHLQPCLLERRMGGRVGDHPRAEAATGEVLALPLHSGLEGSEVDRVVDAVRSFAR